MPGGFEQSHCNTPLQCSEPKRIFILKSSKIIKIKPVCGLTDVKRRQAGSSNCIILFSSFIFCKTSTSTDPFFSSLNGVVPLSGLITFTNHSQRDFGPWATFFYWLLHLRYFLLCKVFHLFNTPSLRNRRLKVMKERSKKAQERKGRARETLEGRVSRVSPSRVPFFLEPITSHARAW